MTHGRKALLFALSLAGVLFAGYMSAEKFFSDTCAFNEPCPYFFGIPACYVGLGLFLVLALVSKLLYFGMIRPKAAVSWLIGVSGLGILFAGYYTLGEIPLLMSGGLSVYALGLPTCAYGLLVYVAIFFLALRARAR